MPRLSWMPVKRTVREKLADEQAKIEKIEADKQKPLEEVVAEPAEWQRSVAEPTYPATTLAMPELPKLITQPVVEPVTPEEPEVAVPFWQRALQIFSAPFEWIDDYVIKPGLSLAGTAVGLVPEVTRLPGEDFWEWKKRSWASWDTPGININVPWSDDPWRVDVKGVLELAPWLLIPGAGQVGAGARVGRGVAGFLGGLGRVGKVAGYAVEYSPWGMVEKTAGVALKGGVKAIGKVTGGISTRVGERLYGKIPEPAPPAPVVQKLTKFFDESVIPARKEFEKAIPVKLRGRQYASAEEVWASARKGEITYTEATDLARKSLGGGIKEEFAIPPWKRTFTNDEVEELIHLIDKSAEDALVQTDSAFALKNLLLNGELPQPHHIRDFAKVYGEEFAKSVGKFARIPTSKGEKIIDALNLPRAVLASADLSATFRQGLILMLTHPGKAPSAFWRQLKAFASEKITLEMDDMLRSRPLYRNAIDSGVEFTAIKRGARLIAKEEPFASNLAQRLPMVRRSERAFTTFLNEMRMSSYEAAYGAMTAQGATAAEFKLLGGFINMASGRGTLPANLNKYAPLFNTVLFSPRYQMSTLQLPRQLGRMLLSKNPYMRKEASKALVTFLGGGAALLSLFQATGKGKVEIDPRSGDFGKIIIGETRLDIWRGYVQYARFVAQIMAGERKSAYGNMNKAQRDEIAWRFFQSKSSPALGLIVDLMKGENYMGEPLFEKTTGAIKAARNRFMPIALQDVIDAMEESGANGAWTAIPSTLGIGVLTYVNDLVRVKEKIARTMGYENWDEIDPKTQREIENINAELQAAYIEFDRQVMGTAWGDWRNAGKAIEDTFRENVENAVAKYRQDKDGYSFREKVSDAFIARRGGYDAREKELRFEDIVRRLKTEDTAEALVNLGPEQLAIKLYNDALWGDDMYDEFGDYRFDEAEARKQQLRQHLGDEMFEYVEEYRGLKYGDFPDEFRELITAKEVMRQYWQVRTEAIKIFGEPKTLWQEQRLNRFIQRIRKQLRANNPEIAKYYQMFYTQ